MSDERAIQQFLQAYSRQDFESAYEQGRELMISGAPMYVMLLSLASLLRAGQWTNAEQMGDHVRQQLEADGWHQVLVQLLLGKVAPDVLKATAKNDDQRAQIDYYSGCLFLAMADIDRAREHYQACVRVGVSAAEGPGANETEPAPPHQPTLEQQLATTELATLEPGPGVAAYCEQLNRCVVVLLANERHADGYQLAKKLLPLFSRLLPDSKIAYVQAVENLAGLLHQQRKFGEALPLNRQNLEHKEQLYGKQSLPVAVALVNLGQACRGSARMTEAREHWQKALGMFRAVREQKQAGYAVCLDQMAELALDTGDPFAAEPLLEELIPIVRSREQNEYHLAYLLNNLGSVYAQRGKTEDSRPLFEEASDIYLRTEGAGSRSYQRVQGNLQKLVEHAARQQTMPLVRALAARNYELCANEIEAIRAPSERFDLALLRIICRHRLGRLVERDQLAGQALRQLATSPWQESLVRVLLGQADVVALLAQADGDVARCQAHYYRGAWLLGECETAAAMAELQQCAAIGAKCLEVSLAKAELEADAPQPASYASSLNMQVAQLLQSGQHELAVRYAPLAYQFAQRQAEQVGSELALARNQMAQACQLTGDFARAQRLYRASLAEKRRSAGLGLSGYLGTELSNLAGLLSQIGKHAEAAAIYQQAVDNTRQRLGKGSLTYCQAIKNLAQARLKLGQFDAAESLLASAVEALQALQAKSARLAHSGVDHSLEDELATCQRLLAEVPEARSRAAASDETLVQAQTITDQARPAADSTAKWFFRRTDGRARGPFTSSRLKDLIRAGQLSASSEVSLDGQNWYPATRIKGIRWA